MNFIPDICTVTVVSSHVKGLAFLIQVTMVTRESVTTTRIHLDPLETFCPPLFG